MKKGIHILFCFFLLALSKIVTAQTTSPAPYCCGTYGSGLCSQAGASNAPGNFINDFIDNFSTSGANTNISNLNSGCNGNPDNCVKYCSHYMAVSVGQTIVCTISSGITFAQGFAIWVDWDQDNIYNATTEYVGGTAGVPAAATATTITFVIPSTQPNGTYSMRVRCAFATVGSAISPCGSFSFGETEDYTIFVGPVPVNSSVPSGSLLVNTPVCVGQPLNFTLSTSYTSALSYTWTGPNSYSSTLQNPTITNPGSGASGIYTVLITNSICPITRTVSALVVAYPTYTPVANHYTICQGGNVTTTASMTTSPSLNTYFWSSSSPGLIFNPQLQSTYIQPGLLPLNVSLGTIIYSVTVSPSVNPACSVTQTLSITINNPLTPTLSMPSVPQCNTFNPVQLMATPGGGTWSANPAVTANGSFSPTLAIVGTNSVLYSVSVGTCNVSNTATLMISKFISSALSSSIASRCVQDPIFNLMNIVQNTVTGSWTSLQSQVTLQNNFFNVAGLATGNYSLMYSTKSQPDTTACPHSTVLVVSVFNPPVPVIATIAPKCNTSGTVALTATPLNGVWSGAAGVSPAGIRTPSLNLIGTNTVSYTAGQGTCVATSSKTFHLSQFNTAALSGSIAPMCETNNPINLMSSVQNTNGAWSGGFYVSPNNYFNPANLPTNTYTLTYTNLSTPMNGLCDNSSPLAISVLNPQVPTIKQVGPYCSVNSSVQLTVSPAGGSWVTTPYLTATGLLTPSLGPVGNITVQYIIGTNTCNAQQTKTISIEGFVSSAILSNIPDQCTSNFPVSLFPLTLNQTGYWTGSGVTGSSFNPSVTGAGSFNLTYHTASIPSGLCPDVTTMAVQVFSLEAPTINKAGPYCNISLPVQLTVTPVGGLFGGPLPGALSLGGVFNPALAQIGDNLITYTISVGPCKAYAQARIAVDKFVSAGLGKMMDTVYCKSQLPFNLNSFVQNTGGVWSGPGVVGNTNMFDPSLASIGGQNELFYDTHSANSSTLCPDRKSVRLWVKDIPVVSALSTTNTGCAPFEVHFYTPSINVGVGSWNISDGSEYSGLDVDHLFKNPGTYTVVFNYRDAEAQSCATQVVLSAPIVVKASPKADFSVSPEDITISEPSVTLTNLSTSFSENRYVWTIQGQGTLNAIQPIVKFNQPGKYKITLMASTVYGCKDETSKLIDVKSDFQLYIPNSFTPNYDGINDVFIPIYTSYGLDAKVFEMEIYDRWGHLVFRSRDITKGWDGTVSGGEIAKEGTYVYKIKYKDLDGKVYNPNGHITLLRN